MSTFTEELKGNNDDKDAVIVELVAAIVVEFVATIVSVTDGSDTMKNFITH